MGTAGQDGAVRAHLMRVWYPQPGLPGRAACTVQAARGAQCVQHLLTPLGEAILGPGDALEQLQQLLFLFRLFAHRPTRQVAVRVTERDGGEAQESRTLPRPPPQAPAPTGTHLMSSSPAPSHAHHRRPRRPPERGAAAAVLQAQAAGQAPAALEGVLPEPQAAAAPTLVGPAPQRPSLRHPLVQRGGAQAPELLQRAVSQGGPGLNTHTQR